jgi:hypothetical protein
LGKNNFKSTYTIVAGKIGLLDNLRPHLEAVTRSYKANESILLSMQRSSIPLDTSEYDRSEKIKRDILSEIRREQGNKFFKENDICQAMHMYTGSIAAAIEGPLASMGYSNRYICIMLLV